MSSEPSIASKTSGKDLSGDDLDGLSASALARAIAGREISAREVMQSCLDRIDACNGRYNAIVSLRPRADLLAEAEAADRAVLSGQSLGPLHGLPVAIKDLAATRHLRTTLGSPLFANNVPAADAVHVARMRAAGALIVGKTNVPEFGLGSHTVNPVFGPTRNAFDPTRSAGGSSGGAAVALALGMLPIADGSDFGGSLRNPAGWNNVFGVRPSQERVPGNPVPDAYMSQLATDGPMGTCVADLALLLDVQAGFDPSAPLSLPKPDVPFVDAFDAERPFRIAWMGDLGGHLAMEDGILPLCRTALTSLAAAGHIVEDLVPNFDYEALWRAFVTLRQFSIGGKLGPLFADAEKRALLGPAAQWECEGHLRLTAAAVYEATTVRSAWYACMTALFDRFDALALPSAQVWPFPIEMAWPDRIAGRPMDSYHRWMEVVVPATLAGCPAASVPAGFGGPGGALPMGLQIIGRPRDDAGVLRICRAYERANPWIAARTAANRVDALRR